MQSSRTTIPHQLSGGMRKRVALAQTFINGPEILLMDEPFSALDVQTRVVMHEELLRLWAQSKASVVFVTHDLEEAIGLADKVYVLTARPATVKSIHDDRHSPAAGGVRDSLHDRVRGAVATDLGGPQAGGHGRE